jgi:hypothetical protein
MTFEMRRVPGMRPTPRGSNSVARVFFTLLHGDAGWPGQLMAFMLLPIVAPAFTLLVFGFGALGWWVGLLLADFGQFDTIVDRVIFLVSVIIFGAGVGWISLRALRRSADGLSTLGRLNVLAAMPIGAGLVLLLFPPQSLPPTIPHVAGMILTAIWLARFQYSHRFTRRDPDAWW